MKIPPDGSPVKEKFYEFPNRMLDGNDEVKLFLPAMAPVYTKDNEFLGYVSFPPFPREHDGYWDCIEFLFKFTKRDGRYFWMKFKTLLVAYRLVEKDFEQFKQVLKTARDEEEFCTLAGLS